MKILMGMSIVLFVTLSSLSAYAQAICGLVDRLETVYTAEKTIPADYSQLDQGLLPQPTVIPASELVKVTLNHYESFSFAPHDVKLSLAELAYTTHTQFCFDQQKNLASVIRP